MTTSCQRVVRWGGSAVLCALLLWTWAAPLGAMEPPAADAQALWNYITQEPNFRKWGTWQEFQKLRRSTSPFGFYVKIYINDVALQAKGTTLPPGSILVREGFGMNSNTYAPSDQIIAYTVMYKVKGFNPKGNDWFWVHYSGTGKVMQSGVVDQCLKCHNTARDNDFVLDHRLR
ncbi:MAG: cytochrome P460 family protein [Desulfarculus sp.]|nr:cytochrome P460 family protein [Desulfarculus sp.]